MTASTYDFIAIGVGPFNLGLACLTAPIDELNGLFLDKNECFDWHPGMMLESATLQTPFLADLVTLADPTSPFSFLNYLKSTGRIYAFYIKEDFFLMRREYNQYCQWVIDRLPNIEFNRYVERVDHDPATGLYTVNCTCTKTGERLVYQARRLVLGTGTSPYIPDCCQDASSHLSHTSTYLTDKQALQAKSIITLIGSGQSAAEIYYDLLQEIDTREYTLNWITRSPRFFPLEYSKLTLEMTSPEYIDYFHQLPTPKRDALMRSQKGLYKGINSALINDIYDLLYNKSLCGPVRTNLFTNTELQGCHYDERTGTFTLTLFQEEQESRYTLQTDGLVLSTGYCYRTPPFLQGLRSRLRFDERGRFAVNRNYTIDTAGQEIFVQNAELHTHGLVTPDLGMACYRNAYIIREMLGREHYPVERKIAFQQFTAPSSTLLQPEPAKT